MKKIIMVNGNLYVYNFIKGKIKIFIYDGKFTEIDLKKDSKYKNDVTLGIISFFKKDVLDDIKSGKYKNIYDVKRSLLNRLNGAYISGLDVDFESNIEFLKAIDQLNDEFGKQNENIKEKEKVIEETLNVNLKTLFHSHGIDEFKIDDNKSAVIYEKNGIPHVLTNTSIDGNIYEIVLRSLEFDKLHSKEELDSQIERSFNVEKDRFNSHETRNTRDIQDNNIRDIADYLRNNYGINKIYDVMPSNDDTIGESLLIDYGNGWQLLTIERDNYGVIKSAKLGTKKNLDNDKNITPAIQDIKTETISNDLSKKAKENQIKEILLKLYGNEALTIEDENVIDYYSSDSNFYKLSEEAKETFLQIKDLYNKRKDNRSDKVYKKQWQKKEAGNAFSEMMVVIFLSGFITGAFVYMFFKMLV